MEQHAVPQDITGFKFKLVGNMTLKQFGELAGGAVIAYLFFASTWHPILKWPGVFFFGFLGFALAFLPIEERPLDIWIANFLKSIYQPTLYVWKKNAQPLLSVSPANITTAAAAPVPISQPTAQLWPFNQPVNTTPKPSAPPVAPPPPPPLTPTVAPAAKNTPISPLSIEDLQKLRDDKMAELQGITKKLEKTTTDVRADLFKAQNGPAIITVDELARRRDEKRQADEMQLQDLLQQNTNLMAQIESVKTRIEALAGTDTTQLQTQLNNLSTVHDNMAAQIMALQDQVAGKKAGETPPAPAAPARVRVVEKSADRESKIFLTDVPNVINGIVTNEKGVPLDNTILLVKDKSGNSIRAMKTNQIGQFIASTPLENGTYYLEFERQSYMFDILEITLDGKAVLPIEIHARSG